MGHRLRSGTLLVLILLLATSVAQAATYTEDVELRFSARAGLHLTIQGSHGNMTFSPWNGTDIYVTATKRVTALTSSRARQVADRIEIDVDETLGSIRIVASTAPGQWFVTQAVAFEVLVPGDWFGTIELSTSNGSIKAESINGDIRLETSNGAITVDGHAGRMYARTSNGRIELSNIDTNLYARSSNGRVGIYNATLRGMGEVRTSNGSITLESALREDADYELHTSNGSVTLRLRSPLDVAVDLATSNGSVHLDGVQVLASEISRSSMRGVIGTGQSTLRARTSNGSITVSSLP